MKENRPVIRALRILMPLVAIGCLIVFPPWQGILAWIAPLPDSIDEQVDAAVRHGLDGIIVYVDRAGTEPAFYAAGWHDRATRTPADPQALFKIASISKLYIAAATARLAYEQRVSLDDTLADLLPEWAGRIQYADRITLRMLLQHRSGLPNFTDDERFNWFDPSPDLRKNLELILDEPARFPPDTRYQYSNTNYLLIGMILDGILGYDHASYIKEHILLPHALFRTYDSLSDAPIDSIMSGYHHGIDADLKRIDYTIPGGSMIADARDVGTFLRALHDGSLLGAGTQEIYASVYEFNHTGWLPGYQSIARFHPDLDAVVIQFVNSTGGNTELVARVVYDRIVRILRGP